MLGDLNVPSLQCVDHIQLASSHRQELRSLVGDGADDEFIQVRKWLSICGHAPVFREPLHVDGVALSPSLELEGPGAHRILTEVLPISLYSRRRNDVASFVGQVDEYGGGGMGKHDLQFVFAYRVDLLDRREVVADGARFTAGPVQTELRRLGVERRPIMEDHVFAQEEGDHGSRLVDLPRRRQLGP